MSLKNLFGGFRRAPKEKIEDAGASDSHGETRWVIAGLGNPGEDYAGSRHNAGFRVMDQIAKNKHARFDRRKFKGELAEAELAGARVLLVKPQTYYNGSGECVAAILGYYKVPPSRLIVVHDELDLQVGRLRLKQGGSDAGNRGVRSVEQSLGTPDFIRVRVGVSRPPGERESKDYLLERMSTEARASLAGSIERAAEAVEAIIADGLERAMGRFNQRA
ncbi:MAG TPA: aminoacyl-tRNA hydrolase [Candidatus Binataceae bacterium]|nr:aminoacyl-tRNA hydrolase [Candidatus Binataceae bacterium]